MVSMVDKLLHRRIDVLAQVYVHFGGERRVHETGILGTSACRFIHSTGVLDITAHISDTIIAGCAHVLVYAQSVLSRWGTRMGGFSLCRALVPWRGGLFLIDREIEVLSKCFLYF